MSSNDRFCLPVNFSDRNDPYCLKMYSFVGNATAYSCTNTSTDAYLAALPTFSRSSEIGSHGNLLFSYGEGFFLIIWGIPAILLTILFPICVIILTAIYSVVLPSVAMLWRYWLRIRRAIPRISEITRRHLRVIRIRVRPLPNPMRAWGFPHRKVGAKLGPCQNLLKINRVQRQSRIQSAINKEPYRHGRQPRPSRAWRRSHRRTRRNAFHGECTICFDNLRSYGFPERNITSSCRHSRTVCLSCVAREIRRNLDDNGWTEARCMTCKSLLSFDDIADFAFEEDFAK